MISSDLPPTSSSSSPENRFDDALRAQLGDVEAVPAPAAWDTLRAQLPPARPVPAPWRARLGTFGGGVVVGALLWWGGGWPGEQSNPVLVPTSPGTPKTILADAGAIPVDAGTTASSPGTTAASPGTAPASPGTAPVSPGTAPVSPGMTPVSPGMTPVSPGMTPVSLRMAPTSPGMTPTSPGMAPASPGMAPWALAYALDSALRHETTAPLTSLTTDTARAARLGALVAAQTRTLAGLQARLDSVQHLLKLALPETPPMLAATADSARTDSAKATATAWPTLPAPRSPWAVLLLTETTPSWAVLPTRAPAPATQEQTVAVLSQQVLGQWQATPRWALRAGVGQTTLTTEARTIADRSTEQTTTTITRSTDVHNYLIDHNVVTIVRFDLIPRYEPILNGSGQIIGYDTTWVPRTDTVRSIITTLGRDSILTTVIAQRTETLREREQQQFRPLYRFWTVPVAVRYALLTAPRWTLGAVAGAQVSVLRDAQRPVWTGEQYELRRVRADQTPYRPVSLSLSAGLEAQYRLSPRLSALFAPTVRWWALRPARGSEGPRALLPAAQVGLVWGF